MLATALVSQHFDGLEDGKKRNRGNPQNTKPSIHLRCSQAASEAAPGDGVIAQRAVEIRSPAPSRASAQAGRHLQGMQIFCQQDHLSHLSTLHSKHSVHAESSGIPGETSLALTLCRSIASELHPDFQKILGACQPPIISQFLEKTIHGLKNIFFPLFA